MKSYQIGYRDNRYYKEYISKEEYIELYNTKDPKDKKFLDRIEAARKRLNDPNIYEASVGENERSVDIYYILYESKSAVSPIDSIPYGIYDLTYNNEGPVLVSGDINSYGTILPIHTELKKIIEKADFSIKNNVLIYGLPGNGKTQSVIDLVNTMPNLLIINVLKVEALRYLKNVPKDMKKVLIFEEFTETMKQNDKRVVLNFLDGIDSVSNTIAIMSTNYPKELETNIIDRPSRIRHFIEYKNPNLDQIDIICNHFNVNAKFFHKKDYSVDNIINVIKTAKEEKISLKEANNKITEKRKFLSETFKSNQGGIGLHSMSYDDDYDESLDSWLESND